MEHTHHIPDLDKPLEAIQLNIARLQRNSNVARSINSQGYVLFAVWIIL